MNDQRQILRKRILGVRDLLTSQERRTKSAVIAENIRQLPEFVSALTYFIYVHFRSEVETRSLIHSCLENNKKVAVPLTLKERITPYLITDIHEQLVPGYCSIPEPDPQKTMELDPAGIDVIVFPGSVFDENGGRLGYGGGYYDRFVQYDAPQALRIGLCFECQIVPSLPLFDHDQHIHLLVTEKWVRDFRGGRKTPIEGECYEEDSNFNG